MCGDPYPVELILGPLLHHQNCWRSSTRPDTIILETYLGFDKRRVQITLTSYHSKSRLSCKKKKYMCLIIDHTPLYTSMCKGQTGTLFRWGWGTFLNTIKSITKLHNYCSFQEPTVLITKCTMAIFWCTQQYERRR